MSRRAQEDSEQDFERLAAHAEGGSSGSGQRATSAVLGRGVACDTRAALVGAAAISPSGPREPNWKRPEDAPRLQLDGPPLLMQARDHIYLARLRVALLPSHPSC